MRPKTTFQIDLTEEQIASYRDNGYLSIERITTDEEIEWLKEIYDQLFVERAGEEKGMYYDLAAPRGHSGREVLPQVLGPDLKIPELRMSQHFQNALKLGTQLLGTDEKVSAGGHMIFKPARYGAETPWHQDEAYWNPDVYLNSLSVWMPLDEATVESGCMQFIPGSHKEDLRWHRHIDNDPLIHGLMTDDVDPSTAVACPLAPGGATFHHSRTLHHTAPNTTDNPRRAYIIVCSGPTKRREVPAPRPWTDEEREALAKANIDVQVF